jgi:hypothetical protein
MKWNNDQCEYVEVGDFKTLEKLFHYRFVENKRKQELFEALGLKYNQLVEDLKRLFESGLLGFLHGATHKNELISNQ